MDVARTSTLSPLVIVGVRNPATCDAWSMFASRSSFVIDGFDTVPRSMCGPRSHVIAVIACLCMVFSPVAAAIAVGNVHTNWIGPAIARDVWSVLARHRYRRLSLTGSTPYRARARCVVCVSTSSLSSLVVDGFDTLPRSRAMCGLR